MINGDPDIPALTIGCIIAGVIGANLGYASYGIGGAIVCCVLAAIMFGPLLAMPIQWVYEFFTDIEELKGCLIIVIFFLAIFLIFSVIKGLWGVRF